MNIVKLTASTLAIAAVSATAAVAQNRQEIRVVGSSTVFPYSQAAAEEFANQSGAPSPIVESTGTGGGMQIFCGGIGEAHADLTGASRADADRKRTGTGQHVLGDPADAGRPTGVTSRKAANCHNTVTSLSQKRSDRSIDGSVRSRVSGPLHRIRSYHS